MPRQRANPCQLRANPRQFALPAPAAPRTPPRKCAPICTNSRRSKNGRARRQPPPASPNAHHRGAPPQPEKAGRPGRGEGSRAPHVDRSSSPAPGAARQAWPGARKEFSKAVETRSNPFSRPVRPLRPIAARKSGPAPPAQPRAPLHARPRRRHPNPTTRRGTPPKNRSLPFLAHLIRISHRI